MIIRIDRIKLPARIYICFRTPMSETLDVSIPETFTVRARRLNELNAALRRVGEIVARWNLGGRCPNNPVFWSACLITSKTVRDA